MDYLKGFILITTLILTTTIIISADTQNCQLYDTFSSNTLNTSKWSESVATDVTNQDLQSHRSYNGYYRMVQEVPADRGTSLNFLRTFSSGDVVEYDVNYIDGTGNREHLINLDGVFTRYALFGFWNTLADAGVGNDYGKYHVKITFTNEGAKPEITAPNGEIKTVNLQNGVFPLSGITHTLGLVSRTGHNGAIRMYYDNVKICR